MKKIILLISIIVFGLLTYWLGYNQGNKDGRIEVTLRNLQFIHKLAQKQAESERKVFEREDGGITIYD